jgi:RimJ/RimL family protein N-acetyltransferase
MAVSRIPAPDPLSTLRSTAGAAVARLRPARSFTAEYVWYRLDLRDPQRVRRELDPAMTLLRATVDNQALIDQIPHDPSVTSMTPDEVAERMAGGGELWLTVEDGRVAFACWTFHGRGPVHGARDEEGRFPTGVLYMEDSIASPDFRGRGIGPATWSALADAAAAGGDRCIVTKVDVTNTSSRRAVEKVGFRDVARMAIRWRGWSTRLGIEVDAAADPAEDWLKEMERA